MKRDLDQIVSQYVPETIPAASIEVRHRGEAVYQTAAGWLDPETCDDPVQLDTYFDLASVTKLFTTTAFLRLVALGKVSVETPVVEVLPQFSGQRSIEPYEDPLNPGEWISVSDAPGLVDTGEVTFRDLLTHTSGLPAWRPIFRQPAETVRDFVEATFFACPTGENVVYSDLGYILLGWAIEEITGASLDWAIDQLALKPLELSNIQFGPCLPQQTAPTEYCAWRKRRMHGAVHDENAFALAGIAGHAGLFGTATGVAALGQCWLAMLEDRNDFFPHALAQQAVSLQAQDGDLRRGLGWALHSSDPDLLLHPFSKAAFGHTGFTGTSLVVDPHRELVVACLTNEVYHGRKDRRIADFRAALHQKIIEVCS